MSDIKGFAANLQVLLKRLWLHLSPRRQRQFRILTVLMLVSAFAEVISLGAVLPFLGILAAPDKVFLHPAVSRVSQILGWTTAQELVLPVTTAFAVIALAAGGIRMLLLWATTRLAFAAGADFSIEAYRRTLYQPYLFHLNRNSSEVISGITNKVNGVVFGVLLPLLTLVSSAVLLFAIILALFLIDPLVALEAAFGFGSCYGVITWMTRRQLKRNSLHISQEQNQVVKALQEGLGGIRDILMDGTQPFYCEVYKKSDTPLRRAQGNNVFIGGSPRFVIESLGMVVIAILTYFLSQKPGGISTALPILGALALGAQRLLPALQQSFGAWASIAGSHVLLADVIELLNQPLPPEASQSKPAPLKFERVIHFKSIRFRYHPEGPWVINNLDFKIPKGSRIGVVGSTGSGKSTALDILMGLLSSTEGQLLVDGQAIHGQNIRAWQQNIAHVPQSIYLADSTLAENIAFGIPTDKIDFDRVQQAARQAQIAEFIESRPEGYGAFVGERGIRLSGGQRQRIGIARALYKQASLLIFDEATSALDNATEQSVMDSIQELNRDLTIVLIAHRLTTVKNCDLLIELHEGRVQAMGTYDQLLEKSSSFRKMAQTNQAEGRK